ncbi:MAG: alkaline phosphatase family protein [Verrucomicrobiota bacterium]
MKPLLPLFIMVDACGWEIIRTDPFATEFAPYRKRLDSVFGYSSACVPSIVSGRWPDQHRNWCYFVYDPDHSPFHALRPLRWLPKAITSRRLFRRMLTRFVKARLNFRGYFDLYNIPFRHITLYDFTEKKSPLQPGGMNRGRNIFDDLEQRQMPYHVTDPRRTEEENLDRLFGQIEQEEIDFAFVYWWELDALMHRVGNDAPEISRQLRLYERRIETLLAEAQRHYADVRLYVFSDHGMANCEEHFDLRARIDKLPLKMGKDYAVVYDSTMARFWFMKPEARCQVVSLLKEVPQGRILSDTELARLRAYFPDHYFGELIFLVEEGVLIVPSHMGERPIRAMHGYHPSARHSYAALLSNQPDFPPDLEAIPDIYRLMVREAEAAKRLNALRFDSPIRPLETAYKPAAA